MLNKQIMSPKTLEIYEKLIDVIREIRREHKKLIAKAKAKTITPEETKRLRELIKGHNKLEKFRKTIWDNHSLVQIVLKSKK